MMLEVTALISSDSALYEDGVLLTSPSLSLAGIAVDGSRFNCQCKATYWYVQDRSMIC